MIKEILITVKTYPVISTKYQELVCTAGIDLSSNPGKFIRIYPVPFRKLPYHKKYRKYEIWRFNLERAKDDHRIDSYHLVKPHDGGKRIKAISTANGWQERKEIVLPLLAPSMCDLQKDYTASPKSAPTLGLVKPHDVEFIVEDDTREWLEKKKHALNQFSLFQDNDLKPLEKVPFKFSYKFHCSHPKCGGHKMLITDWEIYQLWRNCRDQALKEGKPLPDAEKEAIQKVIEKYKEWMLNRDLYFYVGTVYQYGTWIIIGIFYPPL